MLTRVLPYYFQIVSIGAMRANMVIICVGAMVGGAFLVIIIIVIIIITTTIITITSVSTLAQATLVHVCCSSACSQS